MNVLDKLITLENEAADFGFKWEKADQIMQQIESECAEIKTHLHDQDQIKLQEEIGDLFHAAFSLCVFCQFDPEQTLEKSVAKFERRFKAVKELAHQQGLNTLAGQSFDNLMKLWDQAKQGSG